MTSSTNSFLTNPPYHVSGSFAIITAMDVRQWWGLRRGRETLRLPVILSEAFEGESQIGETGAMIQTAIVSVDYLTSDAGRETFRQYLDELPRFLAAHGVTIDRSLLMDCLAWSLLVTISDATAPSGKRFLDTFETLGLEQLRNTVGALQERHRSGAPPIVLNSDDLEADEHYLSLADFMAVDENSVTLDYHDLDDDDDDDDDESGEALHRVIVDRAPFARAMAATLKKLQGLVDGVCGALGVRYATVVRDARRS